MTDHLTALLTLERIETNIFRGRSEDLGTPQVFGGQVLGQAIQAAEATVSGRPIHSVHAYFLRRGDFTAPILYDVDNSRDGRGFSSRRVVAIQHGKPIFTMAASFHQAEDGMEFQPSYTLPPAPDDLPPLPLEVTPVAADTSPVADFDLRLVPRGLRTEPNAVQWWLKTREPLADDPALHRAALGFVSDFGLISAVLQPHGYEPGNREFLRRLVAASLDHALWFHRPVKVDEWLLYSTVPMTTHGARGLARGTLHDARGLLVATTMQELLIRDPGTH
ncbi:MAG TPA: acyl-CoA thioesterase domain-containing protein [Porticoccaceae bacterium]|nr:thioesterase family protein [Pseudomonadota bacterium]HLS99135.1 acyl-CoA thioesterase domain-containing protein [Porticoccaceae bacterium]